MQNIHKKIRMQNAIYTLIQILSFTQNDTILNYKKMLTWVKLDLSLFKFFSLHVALFSKVTMNTYCFSNL